MAFRLPQFPDQVWDGDTINPERQGIGSDRDPNSQDWDQIVAEVRATQVKVLDLADDGIAGPSGPDGPSGPSGPDGPSGPSGPSGPANVPDPSGLTNGAYILTVSDGTPTWTVHS